MKPQQYRIVPRVEKATGKACLVLPDEPDRPGKGTTWGVFTPDEGHSDCSPDWYRLGTLPANEEAHQMADIYRRDARTMKYLPGWKVVTRIRRRG